MARRTIAKTCERRFKAAIKLSLLLLLLIQSKSGLGQMPGQYLRRSIDVDGYSRQYGLYVPASYDGTTDLPLLVSLHGFAWDIEPLRHPQMDGMCDFADRYGLLVVYPQGLDISFRDYPTYPGWNVDGSFGEWSDVAFIKQLITEIQNEYRVDAARVHVSGYGFGGTMAFTLACEISNIIASVASVSGPMAERYLKACPSVRPLSALFFHGTDDPFFAFEGDPLFDLAPQPVQATADFWAGHNGCRPEPVETRLPDLTQSDFSTAALQEYLECHDGTEVQFYRLEGGGHTWPGWKAIYARMGWANMDVDASTVVVDFFDRNPLPSKPAVGIQDDLPSGDLPSHTTLYQNFPNPSRHTTTLIYDLAEPSQVTLTLLDEVGRTLQKVDSGTRQAGTYRIDLDTAGLASGLYFVHLAAGDVISTRSLAVLR